MLEKTPALIDVGTCPDCPLELWKKWADEAKEAGEYPPYGQPMSIATSTPDGFPSVRVVLLKGVDERGFSFFTNYEGRKGREIFSNPKVAFVIYWPTMGNEGRQVRVEGFVEKMSDAESDAYYNSRHIISRYGANCSMQSSPLSSREELENKVFALKEELNGVEPKRPAHWGGFLIIPTRIEFWCNGFARLHDRVVYESGPVHAKNDAPSEVKSTEENGSLSSRHAMGCSSWTRVRLNP